MSELREGHPVRPETDDSPNPTTASPVDPTLGTEGTSTTEQPTTASSTGQSESQRQSRDMLRQLQQMIDSVTTQARPVMRDVAAKAAELAAVAGERAGPLAHRAAEATERVGSRVAERSKTMAGELRRTGAGSEGPAEKPGSAPAAEGLSGETAASTREDQSEAPPKT